MFEVFSGHIIHNEVWELLQALLMQDKNFAFELRKGKWNSLVYQQHNLFKLV